MIAEFKKYYWFYLLTILGLFFYSFTQIDLSLTFSRITFLRNLVKAFQYVGYFQRPLSTYIFSGLIILLFGFYFYFLKLAVKKKIERKTVWKIIIATAVILVFSYNAFSYDLFNYIFDAKIYTHYHLNPYLHKALDFPGDPMLSFMRWTHRTYPYGPIWLILTIPLSYIGLNLFLPTFFLFKFLIAASYLGTLFYIGKIFNKLDPKREVLGLLFFGLNPLVIIECLVSAHLDTVMIFFAVFAFYKLINKKYFWSCLLLLLSIGIKFSTVFLLPIFVFVLVKQIKDKSISWNKVFISTTILNLLTVILAAVYSGNFQPWYLILPLSFAAFISYKYYVFVPTVVLSLFALFNYAPYLYLGNWNPPVPSILTNLQISSVVVSAAVVLTYYFGLTQKSKK